MYSQMQQGCFIGNLLLRLVRFRSITDVFHPEMVAAKPTLEHVCLLDIRLITSLDYQTKLQLAMTLHSQSAHNFNTL